MTDARTIDVLCSPELLDLVTPIDSAPIPHDDDPTFYLVARFDYDALHAVDEQVDDTFGAFWRETGHLNIEMPYDEAEIRGWGLLSYIWHHDVSTEQHVACAIGELASDAGMDPVEFTRYITTRQPVTTAQEA